MSNKNQYNVLVDMDDAVFTQPATIESDGLEFQDFSSTSGVGKPIWSLDYYSQFFNVDTTDVIERCLKSMYPTGDYATDTLHNQPDLYGPFWIATTVVFSVFVCSSLAGSLAAYVAGKSHIYDFTLLSYAVFVVYPYAFLCPAVVWASTKYFGCQPSLMEIINYYGYSLFVWIPVSQKIRERERKENEEKKKSSKTYVNQAPFRYVERNFKSKIPLPDFTHVIDFKKLDRNTKESNECLVPVKLKYDLKKLSSLFGQSDEECRDAFVLKKVPGLVVIPNAFTPKAQRYLIKQCLSVYSKPPNTSNLDTHYHMPQNGIWSLYEEQEEGELRPDDERYYVPKKTSTSSSTYSDSDSEDSSVDVNKTTCTNITACSDDFQPIITGPKPDPPPAAGVPSLSPSEMVRKLRWVMLGFQYHWPTKTYHLDRRYPFPPDVSDLTKAVVTAVEGIGYEGDGVKWLNTYKGEDYNAEAGVVNYYQYRDTLMGHVDRSELNMEAPLVSLR
ncbi:hypothetical protein BDB01DRAFT_843449 [Pilobolus umbonatus]|nr:hypothetical protein BDB01DRAFT_843449 [Pilobolus umbonatus]